MSSIERGGDFDREWDRRILRKYGVKDVYMREIRNKIGSDKARRIIKDAFTLLTEYSLSATVWFINTKEFNQLTTQDKRSNHGTAYTLGVLGTLGAVERLDSFSRADTMSVYLDGGYPTMKQAQKGLRNMRDLQKTWDNIRKNPDSIRDAWSIPPAHEPSFTLGTIADGCRKDMKPLQAVDVLAYAMVNVTDPFYRKLIGRLLKKEKIIVMNPTPSEMREALDEHIAKRRETRFCKKQFKELVEACEGKGRRRSSGSSNG